MNLVDEVRGELESGLGLKPQSSWPTAIIDAIAACEGDAGAKHGGTLRSRVLREVATRVSVPETHFFRNQAQLAFCADHLSRTAWREERVARMWCAGSATGEEPYTVAMLVDRFSQEPLVKRLEITASDINSNAVQKAREGTYTSWSFRGAPSWCFAYFQTLSPGLVTLRPSPIRDVLSFDVESCQAGAAARADASLDVVTFRNVAIYLREQATQALYRDFARILRPGGLLAIGPSDYRPAAGLFEFLDYHDDSPVFSRVIEGQKLAPKRSTPSPEPRVIAPAAKARTRSVRSTPRTFNQLREAEEKVAKSAFSVVKTLAQGTPDDPLALLILGQAHLSRGEVEDAIRVLRQAVFLSADDALTRYFLALALREAGDVRQAVRQLKNVIANLLPRERKDKLTDQRTDVGDLLSAATFLEDQWT